MPGKIKIFVFLFSFLLALVCSLSSVLEVMAAGPVPPYRVWCKDVKDPEFQSLRPYQTSPCGDPPKAIFCGNTLIFTESHKGFSECENQASGEGNFICHGNWPIGPHELAVNLEGGEFPILGNTQDVKNSQSSSETIDDSEKVNEYVSWYLSGITDKAEYGQTDPGKIVDYSGPVKKLLPQAIQENARIKTIETASTEVEIINEVTGETETDTLNHNQIVVCAQEGVLGIWGKTNAHECYEGNNSEAKKDVYRLISWNGDLSALNKILNRLGTDIWNKRIPPLPWEFEDTILYQKAYNEWRGKSCAIVLGKLLCIDNPLVRNKWAELFPYIPLASTADKIGKEKINSVSIQPSGGTQITDSSYGEPQSPGLYFAHTQEVKDISETLNKTYTPLDIEISPVSTTEVNDLSACRVLDVRSNQGDDLFPGVENNPKDTLIPDVTYTITEVPCTAKWNNCQNSNNPYCIPGWDVSCEATITIEAKMITKVPWADEIWSQTVADSASTFRKIFPKVEAGAPVECIADLPAATKVDYLPITQPAPRVLNPGDSLSTSPELYFPHIGGVYEYFLKGIQTALRPQGFGGPITNGSNCSNLQCGELPNLPSATGSCKLGGISSRVGDIPQSLKDVIEAASETYKTPPNLILGIMYGEGLFDGNNKKDWTEENVKNWATCLKVPGCNESGDDNFLGFNGDDWTNVVPNIKDDLLELDPNRTNPSQCNLLDAIYGLAWNLHDSADGGMAFSCFGIDLNAHVPNSCSWDNNQFESAIKVAGSGYEQACLTKEGSCLTGGGLDAACPNGDTCETISNRYSNPSHNGCVWDVAHGN